MKWLFCPIPQGKNWDGTTIYTDSLGGSEAAVAYTARELARIGEEVHVLGNPAPHHGNEPREIDQVTYWPQSQLVALVAQEWDIVVSSRWIDILRDVSWNTHATIAWLHDMPHAGWESTKISTVVFVSRFQQASWGQTDETSVVIGNGYDPSVFVPGGERSENQLIWTSNPDRGLPLATKIFQEVRKRWPAMELHIYGRSSVYGWGPEVEGPFLPRPEHVENVFLHEAVKRSVLAKKLQEAWAFFYPTFWPETYCMATLEAQACGTPVIASPLAALNETVGGGVLTYDILNGISQLRHAAKYNKEQEAALLFAKDKTWEVRAEQWKELGWGLLK